MTFEKKRKKKKKKQKKKQKNKKQQQKKQKKKQTHSYHWSSEMLTYSYTACPLIFYTHSYSLLFPVCIHVYKLKNTVVFHKIKAIYLSSCTLARILH